ncbi:hypothetical protein PAXRUDRAFT_133069, partial [Paxillus rubicundulus Ve08.2h10]
LFNVRLCPSTQKSPRTVFTLQMLNIFRLMNLKCKVTTMSYNKYPRQITNPVLLDASPGSAL